MFPAVTFRHVPLAAPVVSGLRTRLVAAIRWDFEIGLQSTADLVVKYRNVASAEQVRGICGNILDKDVRACQGKYLWKAPKPKEKTA